MIVPLVFGIISISSIASAQFTSLIFNEDFSKGLDFSTWKHELTLGGGGNWEFQYYINNRSNSYVQNKTLVIKPTLTADRLGARQVDGSLPTTLDIWGSAPADTCTSNAFYGCSRSSGGPNIINPIQSARLRTVNSFSFKYGKLEIQAKMPRGDWLWPAMWLLPVDEAYGLWPASGEIDLVESRGNPASYSAGGNNCFGSTLHYGPYWPDDPYMTTHGDFCLKSGDLSQDFHTYGLVWTENYMYTYIDNDSQRVLNVTIDKSFWERGGWNKNNRINNPWVGQPNNAPFDQRFYLIFNLAVGGTNGYFPDGVGAKPWSDKSQQAAKEFNNNIQNVVRSWDLIGTESALQIRSVKVWQ